jgi:hypothetical protein
MEVIYEYISGDQYSFWELVIRSRIKSGKCKFVRRYNCISMNIKIPVFVAWVYSLL